MAHANTTTTPDLHPSTTDRPPRGDGSFKLGRIRGIQITAHWSLLVIFLLISFSLGAGTLVVWHPEWSAPLRWTVALSAAILFFASIALHELAHALVGRRHGIEVDRVTLFVFGGMAHMRTFPPSPKAELLMALAGPLTSLVIGVAASLGAGALIARTGVVTDDPVELVAAAGPFATLLMWLGPVNLMLAVFNILPGFPLDGGRVLRATLWWATGNLRKATRWASAVGSVFGWTLFALGVLMLFGFSIPFLGRGPVSGVWLMLIGWFLQLAARSSYQHLLVREALDDVPVARVMRRDVVSVAPTLPLDVLVADYMMHSDQRAFPVVREDGQLAGVVSIEDVRAVPRADWPRRSVGEVIRPPGREGTLAPADPAFDALLRMGRSGIGLLPVVEHGQLQGVVQRQDLLRWLSLHEEI